MGIWILGMILDRRTNPEKDPEQIRHETEILEMMMPKILPRMGINL